MLRQTWLISSDDQDAEKAIEVGVEGIVVSNHGLLQLIFLFRLTFI